MFSTIGPGAGVAVVAPASGAPESSYRDGLEILAARYSVVHAWRPEDYAAGDMLPYLAAADDARLASIDRALADPRVGAVFCARGGYGSTRILDRLDATALRARRAPLIGFSDITAIHGWAARAGVPSIHGPVVSQLASLPGADVDALFALLEGRELPSFEGLEAIGAGSARGTLVGGNLTLLGHLCGTPYLPELAGSVLLLEDTGEAPYRVDRALTQLLAGGLGEATGVVVGSFDGCDAEQGVHPRARRVSVREVLDERLGSLGVPILFGLPVGHGARNVALPLGVEAEIDAEKGSLRFSGT